MAPPQLTPDQQIQAGNIRNWINGLPGGSIWGHAVLQQVDKLVAHGLFDVITAMAATFAGKHAESLLMKGAEQVYGKGAKAGFFYGGMVQMEAMGRQLLKTGGFLSQFQVGLEDVGRAHVDEAVHLAKHMADLREYGVSYDDYGKAITTVATGYMGVVNDSFRDPEVRKAIRDHVAIYEELGIGGAVATDAFNFFGTVLAGRSDDVIKATNQMDALARISGQSIGAITKDVLANKASFVGFMDPESIVKIGGALQQYGKQLGLGMGPVLKITEKFDTFESAFDTSARLNQVLMRFGASIDPRQLVGMTPEQRIKELNRVFSGIKGQMMAQGPVVRNLLLGALGDIVGKEEAAALISGKLKEAKMVPETAKLEQFAKDQAKAIVDPMQKLIATIQAMKLNMTASPEMIADLSGAFSKTSDSLFDAWNAASVGIGESVVATYKNLVDTVGSAEASKKVIGQIEEVANKLIKKERAKQQGDDSK